MKNTIRILGIISLILVVGFTFFSCDSGGGGGTPIPILTPEPPPPSLDGTWMNSSGRKIFVSSNTGIILDIGTTSGIGLDAVNKGYVKVGDSYWKDIKSTGTLTWSCQLLQVLFNTSNPNVAIGTGWTNCTITMSANGQTINDGGTTWTRQQQ